MRERPSDRAVSIVLSVLLHGAVVGVLAFGWWSYKNRPKPPAPTLAIEATVVDSRTLRQTPQPPPPPPKPEPKPEPPPPEPEPEPDPEPEPPKPTPEEIAEQERQAEEQRLAEEKKAEEARIEAEKRAAEERKREEQRRLAEAKRRAEEKRKAEEKRLQEQRESELRRSMEAEEQVRSAQASGELDRWLAQIKAKIQSRWQVPLSARPTMECTVHVTQVPGGTVTAVRIGDCNADAAVRNSLEAAVNSASPLPPPPNQVLFDRNLVITFKGSDLR
jgi:colicin import membrane protein